MSFHPQEKLDHTLIKAQTDKIFDKLVKIRRAFHTYPELAGKENRTQEFIKQYLSDLGLEVETGLYGHSVVGILKGKKNGKKVAWRADMDALPIDFADSAPFKSLEKGVQHGCGHDFHMAIGLGIAEILSQHRESLHGTVYFIFQPEEETFEGARQMIEHGLFSKINPDEIYGLHVTAIPVGHIMVKADEMFAYQKRVRIRLRNTVSKEDAKVLSQKIFKTMSRSKVNGKPWDIQNIDNPEVGLQRSDTDFKNYMLVDQSFNIYSNKDETVLEGYLYETDASNLDTIIPRIEKLIREEKYGEQLVSVSFSQQNPTVLNDKNLTSEAVKTLNNIYGKDLILPDYGQVPIFNDDFAYFQKRVPGVYFFLGGSNTKKGIVAMNHAPNFNVDEESISVGVSSFSSLLLERLNSRK